MQELDPSMYDKIKNIRDCLIIGNISLLDNLIGTCYDSYTDEEIKSLFGLEGQKMNYQNGVDNLNDAYFSINKGMVRERKKLM